MYLRIAAEELQSKVSQVACPFQRRMEATMTETMFVYQKERVERGESEVSIFAPIIRRAWIDVFPHPENVVQTLIRPGRHTQTLLASEMDSG